MLRPFARQKYGQYNLFCTHDGNKNVSDVVSYQTARGVPAHYEYAPFGAVTAATTNTAFTAFNVAETNPFRFSSEYSDDMLGLVYYNYRHYNPEDGRWCALDSLEEIREIPSFNIFIMANNLYQMNKNDPLGKVDMVGLVCGSRWNDWIVPDAPGGFDFSKPCQSHDDCYGKCGSKKADCDGKFLEDMRSVCANQPEVVDGWCIEYIGNNMAIQRRCKKYPRKKCLEYAELYHLAVDKYGQGAFDNAQKEGKSED